MINKKKDREISQVLPRVTHYLSMLATGGVKPVTTQQLTGAALGSSAAVHSISQYASISVSQCTQYI